MREQIRLYVGNNGSDSEIAETIQVCKPSEKYSNQLFEELIFKVWTEEANKCVKRSSIEVNVANNLLTFAENCNIKNKKVEQYLLKRLENIKYLDRLQKNQAIGKDFSIDPAKLALSESEKIIWQFEDISKIEQERYSQEKPWVLLRAVLNNAMLRSRYKELATRTEDAGELIITNLALYYLNNNKTKETKFSDIYSVTPMKYGVRIQANTSGATPDTYTTGDGRFTYALLQYSRNLND